jgi:hypothetical protein
MTFSHAFFQAFRAIFTGPLTALDPTSRKGTKHPKGVIHGMAEPSPTAIAYAAIQVHFFKIYVMMLIY